MKRDVKNQGVQRCPLKGCPTKGFQSKESRAKRFSLIELFVVVAVLLILISLLQPSLSKMMARGESLACQNNLKELGSLSFMFGADNDDKIPGSGFSYNDTSTPDWWPSSWASYEPYTGPRISNQQDFWFWFSKGHLGQYLFDTDYNGNWQKHELYSCDSSTITTDPDGNEVEFTFSYWVNVNQAHGKKAPWASNSGITNKSLPSWTRFGEIIEPSHLMSIADVAQNLWGTVDASGSFNLVPHYYDDVHAPAPVPGPNPHDPDGLIGPATPAQQGQRASRRGIFDFRHSFGINAAFIDGHVENVLNGDLKNKNLYRQ